MQKRMHISVFRLLCLLSVVAIASRNAPEASAQITAPRVLSTVPDRFATLEEQLVNRLKATTRERRGYLTFVVNQARTGRLDTKLVVAIERYARRKNPQFPFPFFERALRHEAAKRGIALPRVQQFVTTKTVID